MVSRNDETPFGHYEKAFRFDEMASRRNEMAFRCGKKIKIK